MELSWVIAEINTTCLEEALAVAGGCNYSLIDSTRPSTYHYLLIYSYTVIKDIEGKGFLTDKTAATDLWPKLHYRYSLKSSPTKLGMVKGTFTAVSTSVASSSSAGPSSSTSTSASLPPTRVKVTRHMTGGQLWYAWKSGGLDDRGLANEWITVKDQNGAAVVVHKAKNLVSTPP